MEELDDAGRYKVVVNHEEQYSIWPEDRENPIGWSDVGVSGARSECLDHIEKVWQDMRPLSLRRWMEEHPADVAAPVAEPPSLEESLVDYLAADDREVALVVRGESEPLASLLARDFVQVRFPATKGGTELTVRLDPSNNASALAQAAAGGEVSVVGTLELDYRTVECRAVIDATTLRGKGRLRVLTAAE